MRRWIRAVSRALVRWTEAADTPAYRIAGVVVGLTVAAGIALAPTPEGLSAAGQRAGAVLALMALWWVGRVLPLAVTSLVPLVAFPLLGVLGIRETALPYAHHLNFLMLGGFVLGFAMEEAGLHHRLVAAVLRPAWVRAAPERLLLALMGVAAVLSGLVSNTATTLMLLPLALGLARLAAPDDPRARSGFVLGLAYAASIGGVTTLVGTPPNAILAREVPSVSFASWLAIGVPFAAVMVPAAWWVVAKVVLPLPERFSAPPEVPALARWTGAQRAVAAVVGGAMALWLTRKPVDLGAVRLPGWSEGFAEPSVVQDSWVAVLAALVVFLIPAGAAAPDRRFLVTLPRLETGVPWSVLLLLGGGFSLAEGLSTSGLTTWLAGATAGLGRVAAWSPGGWELGGGLAIALIAGGMTLATELTSNTATTQIVLPVLGAGAVAAGADPMVWMVPATVSASCAFMMPVATLPNAIATEAGGVSPADMAFAGALLNALGVVAVTALALLLVG